jgi:serine/threonine protein kinase/dienelactone hydrolase
MALPQGTQLGPYVIVALLGHGGMGVVYRARDERLQRDVAIKVLPPGLLSDEPAKSRFRKEALALARLSHPNIAAVFDVGEQDGMDYLVMECVPGQTLSEKMGSQQLPAKEILSLGLQVAGALEEAHEQGVVHRDLKPSNIMITPKGHAKVLDFGLAKLFEPVGAPEVTRSLSDTHGPVGTALYMSPEQAEGRLVDSRTDLWSFGVVLYEALAGRPPFQGASSLAIFRAISTERPKSVRDIRPETPEGVDQIVSHALEKDPSKRYQSASEISGDLSGVLLRLSASSLPLAGRNSRLPPRMFLPAIVLLLITVAFVMWLYQRSERRHWAREEAIPAIAKLKSEDKPLAAFLLLEKAEQYLPGDPQLARLAEQNVTRVSVTSSPRGATVEIKDYLSPDAAWYRLGETPLTSVQIPTGYFRWRVSKAGIGESVAAPITGKSMHFALDSTVAAPPGMSWVDGASWISMIAFVGWVGPYEVPAYYIDRMEVTNRQYQEFVDKGGYEKEEYWPKQFLRDGRALTWQDAKSRFRDTTGRTGPSTWAGGHYAEGQGDYPVSGVSWYEAAAYASFAGKSLPTFVQWYMAAPSDVAGPIIEESNISKSGPAPVGTFKGLGPFGTYDMAGNVREWVQNATTSGTYFILGGTWKSPTYLYYNPEALSAWDRSATNGVRCVRNITPVPENLTTPIKTYERDFAKVKPVTDDVFRAYETLYAYDKTPLNAKVESVVQDTADWREEKITFDTAYDKGRMAAYLFLPKKVSPPFQTVVFFPSAGVIAVPSSETLADIKYFDYIVQSGRAVMYPIYQGTYERSVNVVLPGTSQNLEYMTERYKDLARSIDYLETRSDIDKNKLAYLGVSMGAAEGVIYTTLAQDRLKTMVLLDGGYFLYAPPAGGDQADFAPRLKRPVMMVNGRFDYVFSVDEAQDPLFKMLGTPPVDKRHVEFDTPHDVTERRPELIQNVLDWLDKYLGRVD